jgi:hypothetical protein
MAVSCACATGYDMQCTESFATILQSMCCLWPSDCIRDLDDIQTVDTVKCCRRAVHAGHCNWLRCNLQHAAWMCNTSDMWGRVCICFTCIHPPSSTATFFTPDYLVKFVVQSSRKRIAVFYSSTNDSLAPQPLPHLAGKAGKQNSRHILHCYVPGWHGTWQ